MAVAFVMPAGATAEVSQLRSRGVRGALPAALHHGGQGAGAEDLRVTLAPAAIMIYANFMHRVGLLKVKPQTWKDAFMSELYGLPGSWSG